MVEERYYLAYVLGYDMLHAEIVRSPNKECDSSFEICLHIIDEFMDSEEYRNMKLSAYDSLSVFISNNYDRIVDLFWE